MTVILRILRLKFHSNNSRNHKSVDSPPLPMIIRPTTPPNNNVTLIRVIMVLMVSKHNRVRQTQELPNRDQEAGLVSRRQSYQRNILPVKPSSLNRAMDSRAKRKQVAILHQTRRYQDNNTSSCSSLSRCRNNIKVKALVLEATHMAIHIMQAHTMLRT